MRPLSRFSPSARWMAALLFMMIIVSLPHPSLADVPVRRVGWHLDGSDLRVSFGFRDVCTERVREKLRSGLPTRLVIQVAVETDRRRPVAFFARTVEVVYDLWEDNFLITIEDPDGRRRRRITEVSRIPDVIGVLVQTRVAANLPSGTYRLSVHIEANPVSEQMVRNIQRWISRPSGGGLRGGAGPESFFGSFVGRFVNRNIGKADHTVRFVSQWFEL